MSDCAQRGPFWIQESLFFARFLSLSLSRSLARSRTCWMRVNEPQPTECVIKTRSLCRTEILIANTRTHDRFNLICSVNSDFRNFGDRRTQTFAVAHMPHWRAIDEPHKNHTQLCRKSKKKSPIFSVSAFGDRRNNKENERIETTPIELVSRNTIVRVSSAERTKNRSK